tara:strand:- start:14 stop:178 length:165 start_codon:yes stop_codon:yes gene_type:complete
VFLLIQIESTRVNIGEARNKTIINFLKPKKNEKDTFYILNDNCLYGIAKHSSSK